MSYPGLKILKNVNGVGHIITEAGLFEKRTLDRAYSRPDRLGVRGSMPTKALL